MKSYSRADLALILLVLACLAGLFALLLRSLHSWWLLAGLAALLYPNIPAFIDGAPFVPTPPDAAEAMAAAAGLKPGDSVVELGCGDGRLCRLAAAKYGARAVGYELSPPVWLLALVRKALWRSPAAIRFGDFRRADLSGADAVFFYLLPESLARLEPKLRAELKPGARAVAYRFPLPGWREKLRLPCGAFVYEKGWSDEPGRA